ncbi:pilus assembly protein TadG-related protein [Stappia sp.]|uniref:pilus assembly protein TadG-related protein n=1 Tax=Stappia sp. TaxID=1870903 RepID=UPI003A9943F7
MKRPPSDAPRQSGIRARLAGFVRDRRGNIVIPFAIAAGLMIMIVGAGVDFSRGYTVKIGLQQAVDATALAANYDSNGLSDAKIRERAEAYFNSIYKDPDGIAPELLVSVEKGTVSVTAKTSVPTKFGGLLGLSALDVEVNSQTVVGKAVFDVAMVLDNSGSMRGSKMSTLKSAATDLTKTLFAINEESDRKDRVKIGLVPFTSFVNIGPANQDATWMDREGKSPIHWKNFETRPNGTPDPAEFDRDALINGQPSRFSLYKQLKYTSWRGCVESRPMPYDVDDTAPTASNPATLYVPQFAPDEPDDSNAGWYDYFSNSYLYDDDGSCDSRVRDVYWREGMERWEYAQKRLCKYRRQTRNYGTSWTRGPNYNCRTQELTDLTNNKSSVLNAINSMNADGNTNIHQGAVWGWRLLTPQAPFTSARDPEKEEEDTEYVRILIIMTDGDNTYGQQNSPNNTQPEAYGYGTEERLGPGVNTSWSIPNKMDERVALTCSNAKKDGVQIYTIAFQIRDQNTVTLLRNCATTSAMAFDAQSNGDLVDAFKRIANEITRLRLSR